MFFHDLPSSHVMFRPYLDYEIIRQLASIVVGVIRVGDTDYLPPQNHSTDLP